MKNIQKLIEDNLDITEMDKIIAAPEAARRAARALNVIAQIISARYEQLCSVVSKKSTRDAAFAEAIQNAEGKDAKARETHSRANPDYMAAREDYETTDASVGALDAYIRMFENCHIFYRNLSKEIVE